MLSQKKLWRTDNTIAKIKRTERQTKIYETRNRKQDRATRTQQKTGEWTEIPRNIREFLLRKWLPSCYSCYKPNDKSWIRTDITEDRRDKSVSIVAIMEIKIVTLFYSNNIISCPSFLWVDELWSLATHFTLSIVLQFTAFVYPFGIFKLFFP